MKINNNGVILRNAVETDIEQLTEWWSDGKIMSHAGFPKGIKTDRNKLLSRIREQNLTSLPLSLLMIIELENGKVIGEMNYKLKEEAVFELGIKICDFSMHGKGYGELAMKGIIEYLKKYLTASKIVLDTNLNNTRAQNFYKRIGFKEVKILKDNWKDQLGNLQSSVIFEMAI